MYTPTESLLLLAPELLAPLNIEFVLLGLPNCPLGGRLNLFSLSTSDRNGLFGVN